MALAKRISSGGGLISVTCPYLCRENGAESESVGQLVEEGNPFETDVVAGVEHADNNEKKRSGHT
jgi:hypothetical protein